MLLYHGSRKSLESLKPQQARTTMDRKLIPEGELLHAIYLTPEFEFAFAMAARPDGVTHINGNKIEFEKPELFDPNREVYVYEIDSSHIPRNNLKKIDDQQYVVEGLEEVNFAKMQKLRAKELLKYYELVNWKEGDDHLHENSEPKILNRK